LYPSLSLLHPYKPTSTELTVAIGFKCKNEKEQDHGTASATVIAHKHNVVTDKEPTNVSLMQSVIVQRIQSNTDTNTEKEQETQWTDILCNFSPPFFCVHANTLSFASLLKDLAQSVAIKRFPK